MTMRGWWWLLVLAAALVGCGDTSSTADDGGGADAEDVQEPRDQADTPDDGDDGAGPATCEMDFDCPADQLCADGVCVPIESSGVCVRPLDRPIRRRVIGTGFAPCGSAGIPGHGFAACMLRRTASGTLPETHLIVGEGGIAFETKIADQPSMLLAATEDYPDGVLVAWYSQPDRGLQLDRWSDGRLEPVQSIAPSEFGLDDMFPFMYGEFNSGLGGSLHLFLLDRSTIAAHVVSDIDARFGVASVAFDLEAFGGIWPAYAAAVRLRGERTVELLSGGLAIRRYDGEAPDPATAHIVAEGKTPDICRLPSGDLMAAWFSDSDDPDHPGQRQIEFADLPDDLSVAPERLPPFVLGPEVGATPGLYLLDCTEADVSFVVVPRPAADGSDCHWLAYRWDGTEVSALNLGAPTDAAAMCQPDPRIFPTSTAVWSDYCQGGRVLIPWNTTAGEVVWEFFEI